MAIYDKGLSLLLARSLNFNRMPAIASVNNQAVQSRSGLASILVFFEKLLPVKLFVIIVILVWLAVDILVYRRLRLSEKTVWFAPTSNNKHSFNSVRKVIPSAFLKERALSAQRVLKGLCYAIIETFKISKTVSVQVMSDPLATKIQVLRAVSAFLFFKSALSQLKMPIFLANDHAPIPIALWAIAKYAHLKVFYIQHAAISGLFPPLDFDLAILFNNNSLNAYKKIGQVSGVVAFFSPYPDDFVGVSASKIQVVSIATGLFPYVEGVRCVVDWVRSQFSGVDIICKAHPRSSKKVVQSLEGLGLKVLTDEVLNWVEVDLAIAGNSGVIVDALHAGCPVVYDSNLDSICYDYYGFIEAGVLLDRSNIDRPIIQALNEFYDELWEERFSDFDVTVISSKTDLERELSQKLRKELKMISSTKTL